MQTQTQSKARTEADINTVARRVMEIMQAARPNGSKDGRQSKARTKAAKMARIRCFLEIKEALTAAPSLAANQ